MPCDAPITTEWLETVVPYMDSEQMIGDAYREEIDGPWREGKIAMVDPTVLVEAFLMWQVIVVVRNACTVRAEDQPVDGRTLIDRDPFATWTFDGELNENSGAPLSCGGDAMVEFEAPGDHAHILWACSFLQGLYPPAPLGFELRDGAGNLLVKESITLQVENYPPNVEFNNNAIYHVNDGEPAWVYDLEELLYTAEDVPTDSLFHRVLGDAPPSVRLPVQVPWTLDDVGTWDFTLEVVDDEGEATPPHRFEIEVREPGRRGCGCTRESAVSGAPGLALLLPLALRRRRTRGRST